MYHKENQTTIKKHNMNTYKINIGTQGTKYSKVIDAINQKYKRYFEEYNVKTSIGKYKGEAEETVILTIKTNAHITSIFNMIQYWTGLLNQECIAIAVWSETINDVLVGDLVYNTNYKGVKMHFDRDYFLA